MSAVAQGEVDERALAGAGGFVGGARGPGEPGGQRVRAADRVRAPARLWSVPVVTGVKFTTRCIPSE